MTISPFQKKSNNQSSAIDDHHTGSTTQTKEMGQQLARLEAMGGVNAIVPIEGIVFTYKGNVMKLTGTFAPVNQILGVLRYAR